MDFTDDELFETGALLLEAANAAREAHKEALAANKAERAEALRQRAATLLSALRKITRAANRGPAELRAVPRATDNVVSIAG